ELRENPAVKEAYLGG
ncbi:MAG: hypothetical protein ACP5CD_07230, partial [Thermovirgaceae bacterium]